MFVKDIKEKELKLTQEMIDKFNEIGFIWESRPKKEKEDNLSV